MHNYQLYRTNPRLSGQLKWNIIVNEWDNELYVKNMFISPIADLSHRVVSTSEYTMRESHAENIVAFSEYMKGSFYSIAANRIIDTSRPVISNSINTKNWTYVKEPGNTIDYNLFDDTYNMGVKRTSSYQKYGKQFEVFCPVWIESCDTIIFRFHKYMGQTYMGSQNLTINVADVGNTNVSIPHNNFVRYFKTYVNNTVGANLGRSPMYINLSPQLNDKTTTEIRGISIKTGRWTTISLDSNYLSENLKDQEMPMMEFDNKIVSQFKENNIICPQLFNFNFLFDIDDLVNDWERNVIRENADRDFHIKIGVNIDGEELDIVDFYTNYEYIPSVVPDKNVLSELRDYECVDLVDKNKINPHIFHWCLEDNENYLFNLYRGFGTPEMPESYDGASNLYIREYKPLLRNNKWMLKSLNDNFIEFNEVRALLFLQNIADKQAHLYEYIMETFNRNGCWLNNVKYHTNETIHIGVFCVPNNQPIYNAVKNSIENDDTWIPMYDMPKDQLRDNAFFNVQKSDITGEWYLTCIVVGDNNARGLGAFTFQNMIESCNYKMEDGSDFSLKNIFSDFSINNNPPQITIPYPCMYRIATSPDSNTEEIEYIDKRSKTPVSVYRYSGNIKPSFTSINNDYKRARFNYMYHMTKVDSRNYSRTPYARYSSSKYEMKYPSIGFFPIKKFTNDISSDSIYVNTPNNVNLKHETAWFNNSNMYYLPTEIRWTIEYDQKNGRKTIDELVDMKLQEMYPEETFYLKWKYIKSLYNYESDFKYASIDSITNYIYDIKLTLK